MFLPKTAAGNLSKKFLISRSAISLKSPVFKVYNRRFYSSSESNNGLNPDLQVPLIEHLRERGLIENITK